MDTSIPQTTLPTRRKPMRRCFRLQGIPSEWTLQVLRAKLGKQFPGYLFEITSLCKHPNGKLKTALITFETSLPQGFTDDEQLPIDGHKLIIESCNGFTTLFEPENGVPIKADILFVHGLGGHSVGSWTEDKGYCWPRDALGYDLCNVRIMTFGYEAKLNRDTSTSRLSDFGTALRNQLLIVRQSPEHQKRPLFLIGHSFGGTIITWVLHDLFRGKQKIPEYDLTLRAIQCVTFFGVPLQGMSIEYLEPITETRTHESTRRTLNDLHKHSEVLNDLRTTLVGLQDGITFITCEEQKLTPAQDAMNKATGKSYQAVDRNSTRLHTSSEIVITIEADHRNMIKFSNSLDKHYLQILHYLKKSLDASRQISNVRVLNEEQRKELLESLRMPQLGEERDAYRQADEGTCNWLFDTAQYCTWSHVTTEPAPMCLRIHGSIGSGKSILINHALRHARSLKRDQHTIGFFFNEHASDALNTVKHMYQSILFQLVETMHSIPCESFILDHLTPRSYWQTLTLRQLLEYLIPMIEKPIFCFIDATECQLADIPDTVAFFDRIAESCKHKSNFRLCLTSSMDVDTPKKFETIETISLDEHEGHRRDILRFTQRRLQLGQLTSSQHHYHELVQKSTGNFHWMTVAVAVLNKDWSQGRRSAVIERISMLPSGFSELCNYLLATIRESDPQLSNKIMLLLNSVHQASKPPKAEKLYKLIISDTHGSKNSIIDLVRRKTHDSVAVQSVLDLSMGLLDMTGANFLRVRFVHPSIPQLLEALQAGQNIREANPAESPGLAYDRIKNACLDILRRLDAGTADYETAAYAIENIFPNANEAQRGGVSQARFLRDFPLAEWIQLANIQSTDPRFHDNASMLYILADMNMAELISIHPTNAAYLNPEPGMQSTPLFAALANMHMETVSAFLQIERDRMNSTGLLADHKISLKKHHELSTQYLNTLQDAHTAGMIQRVLSSDDKKLSDYNSVLAYMARPGNEILQIFLMLTGRIVWNSQVFDKVNESLQAKQPLLLEYPSNRTVALTDQLNEPKKSNSQRTPRIAQRGAAAEYYDSFTSSPSWYNPESTHLARQNSTHRLKESGDSGTDAQYVGDNNKQGERSGKRHRKKRDDVTGSLQREGRKHGKPRPSRTLESSKASNAVFESSDDDAVDKTHRLSKSTKRREHRKPEPIAKSKTLSKPEQHHEKPQKPGRLGSSKNIESHSTHQGGPRAGIEIGGHAPSPNPGKHQNHTEKPSAATKPNHHTLGQDWGHQQEQRHHPNPHGNDIQPFVSIHRQLQLNILPGPLPEVSDSNDSSSDTSSDTSDTSSLSGSEEDPPVPSVKSRRSSRTSSIVSIGSTHSSTSGSSVESGSSSENEDENLGNMGTEDIDVGYSSDGSDADSGWEHSDSAPSSGSQSDSDSE